MSESKKIIVGGGAGGGKTYALQKLLDIIEVMDAKEIPNFFELRVRRFETFRFIESPPLEPVAFPVSRPHDYWNQFKRKKY